MATTQQAINDGIYALLTANTGAGSLYAAVSGRIYDTEAPQDTALPFVVYTIVSDPVVPYFVTDSIQVEFQIDVYGPVKGSNSGPKGTRAIGDIAFALLHRNTSITATGYSGLSILCQQRAPGLESDMITGGRSSQDAFRDTRMYRLYGTGS